MNLRHYPLSPLFFSNEVGGWFDGSRTLLNLGTARTAVLLIHGWNGDASSTWETFPRALRFSPKAEEVDAFFLQYASKQHAVSFCSAPLADFLLGILRTPAVDIVNPSLPQGAGRRSADWRYDRVIIVGHSMGAVVARRALLDLDRDDLTDTERQKIVCLHFAPAHKGSSLPLLVESGLELEALPGARQIGQALTIYYRSLHDLEQGSQCLNDLLNDSQAARERCARRQGDNAYLRAHVYHAQGDKTVSPDRFDDDRRFKAVMGSNHRQICKPSERYRTPVSALEELL